MKGKRASSSEPVADCTLNLPHSTGCASVIPRTYFLMPPPLMGPLPAAVHVSAKLSRQVMDKGISGMALHISAEQIS